MHGVIHKFLTHYFFKRDGRRVDRVAAVLSCVFYFGSLVKGDGMSRMISNAELN